MGGWVSRWWPRPARDRYEERKKELEELDQQIRDVLAAKKTVEEVRRARLTLLLFLFFIGIILAILHVVIRYSSRGLTLRSFFANWTLIAPFVVLPVGLYLLRALLQFYYGWRTASVNVRLTKLQKQKADKVEALKKAIDFDQVRAMYELVQRHAAAPESATPQPARPPAAATAAAQPAPRLAPRTPAPAVAPAVASAAARSSHTPRPVVANPPVEAPVAAPTTLPTSALTQPVAPQPMPADVSAVTPISKVLASQELRQRGTPVRASTPSGLPKHYQPVNRVQAPPPTTTQPPVHRGWFGRMVDNFIGDVPQNTPPVLCRKCHRPNPPPPSFYELAAYEFSCVYCNERNSISKLDDPKDGSTANSVAVSSLNPDDRTQPSKQE